LEPKSARLKASTDFADIDIYALLPCRCLDTGAADRMQSIATALFIAELGYILVGLDLLRRARRTQGLPEIFLGLAFVFNGLSYFLADLPSVIESDTILNPITFAGRLFAGLCALMIAGFTWKTFRACTDWAKCSFWALGALAAVGLLISALEGDWEGVYPLTYTGFWLEWVAGAAAFIWLAIESLQTYSNTRRQVKFGLADPLLSNRFLLIGIYGVLATSTYPLYLWMYIEYEFHGTWSAPMEIVAGIVELIALASLWLSFSAPAFYRRWLRDARATS
jgi:hypothetical protein